MNNPDGINTQRLTLRSFTPADLDNLFCQLSDPDVMRYYPAVLSREECVKWLEGILHDYELHGFGMLAMCLRQTGEYIGQIGIMRRTLDAAEHYFLSYLLCKKFWNLGYATEAARAMLDYGFRTLGLQRIEALIRIDNARSISLAEKLDMQRESIIEHDGYPHYVYAIAP